MKKKDKYRFTGDILPASMRLQLKKPLGLYYCYIHCTNLTNAYHIPY